LSELFLVRVIIFFTLTQNLVFFKTAVLVLVVWIIIRVCRMIFRVVIRLDTVL
jgi:hypothetical protein